MATESGRDVHDLLLTATSVATLPAEVELNRSSVTITTGTRSGRTQRDSTRHTSNRCV